MNLGAVILQLRAAGTSFGNRIGGSAEFAIASEMPLEQEYAFVLQVGESCAPNQYDSAINQKLVERVSVVVVLFNDSSKLEQAGFTAYSRLASVRTELFTALLGWQPPDAESLMYYAGGKLMEVNRAWLWYSFEFEASSRLQALYDPGAGSLPLLREFFDQWKANGDSVLPLHGTSLLPTSLLTSPILEDLVRSLHDFDVDFSKDFNVLGTPRPK